MQSDLEIPRVNHKDIRLLHHGTPFPHTIRMTQRDKNIDESVAVANGIYWLSSGQVTSSCVMPCNLHVFQFLNSLPKQKFSFFYSA